MTPFSDVISHSLFRERSAAQVSGCQPEKVGRQHLTGARPPVGRLAACSAFSKCGAGRAPAALRCAAALLALFCAGPVVGLEFDARLKLFGTASALPSHDLQRRLGGTPAYDGNADLRLMLRHTTGPLTLLAEHALTWAGGDSHGFANTLGATLDQSPAGDHRRGAELNLGNRRRRPASQLGAALTVWRRRYRRGSWAVTLGRQAVSWGQRPGLSTYGFVQSLCADHGGPRLQGGGRSAAGGAFVGGWR